ncbi:hypothetical protein CKO51_13270 [Rhodopirellula sp. SM50]|nr:hypothetical protein [Rhodopirellula sp. SM50]PAY19093.1 hypothetical protein CKO51_13270 [Rhodopirellula sp. SM50]
MKDLDLICHELRAVDRRPIPYVLFGTFNAFRFFGPEENETRWAQHCIDELEEIAMERTNRRHFLEWLPGHQIMYAISGFHRADVVRFGTNETQIVIDKLDSLGIADWLLLRPDVDERYLALFAEYAYPQRRRSPENDDERIFRVVRRRLPDSRIEERPTEPYSFFQNPGLYPILPDAEMSNATTMTGEPLRDSECALGVDLDSWGLDRSQHCWCFDVVSTDFASAVIDALRRVYRPSGCRISPVTGQKWLAEGPVHPEKWWNYGLDKPIPKYSGDPPVDEYPGDLTRDRFFFWHWQRGIAKDTDIAKAAIRLGYDVASIDQSSFESSSKTEQESTILNHRRKYERYRRDYANATNLSRFLGVGKDRHPQFSKDSI